MFSSPVKPKWTLSPMTAIATAAVVGATISRAMASRMLMNVSMSGPFSADPLGAAEQALGPEQQQQDEDRQRHGVLQDSRRPQRSGQLDHEADDERPDEGAEG